jgi:GMP synthase-like glutamine amidotransferase
MIWYIATDSTENYHRFIGSFGQHKLELERLSGDLCLMLHYTQVDAALLDRCRPWAICHSGGSAMYDTYDVLEHKVYGDCIARADIPQIGFCGGCQILAVRMGSTIGPLRPMRDGEPDLNPSYCPGQLKEWGIYPVKVVQKDPIFKGLPDIIRVQEYHSWEVKELAADLQLLGSTETCRVQAWRHRQRMLYGTQFHPEQSNDNYTDGFKLLTNFFEEARAGGR